MALSNQRQTPIVVDLTVDSDDESEDEAVASSLTSVVTSKAPVRPVRPSSFVSRPAMTNSLSLPGNTSRRDHAPPMKVTPVLTGTNTPSTSRPATAMTTANMERRASMDVTRRIQAQTTTAAAFGGSSDVERGAKRRRLSTSSGKTAAHDGTQAQTSKHASVKPPSKHGHTVSAPAPATSATTKSTNLRAKLNNSNGIFSASFLNATLKRPAWFIPSLDDAPTRVAPLLIGRMPHGNIATGLPSPGLTTPESVSAIMIDSDPLEGDEVEIAQPQASAPSGSKKHSASWDSVELADNSTAILRTIAVQPTSRRSSPREPVSAVETVEHGVGHNAVADLPTRQSVPRKSQQSPIPSKPHASALSPASTPIKPPHNKHSGSATEKADHLLLFLKEVKRLKWAEITEEFSKDIEGRNYVQLQSRYSSVLNKRDRTQDPSTLNLPPRFAAEATIDWSTVYADTEPPRTGKQVAALSNTDSPRKAPANRPRAAQQARYDSDSAGADSMPQRQRAARAAPIDYTWPQLRTVKGGFDEVLDVGGRIVDLRADFGGYSRSESPSDETLVPTTRPSTFHLKPLDMRFQSHDAKLGLAMQRDLRKTQQDRTPYLSSSQRLAMRETREEWVWDQLSIQNWQGIILHVDFSPAELRTVENAIAKLIPSNRPTRHSTYRRHLRATLKDIAAPKLKRLAHEIGRHLRSRDARSITSFLEDAAAGKISNVPQIQRLASVQPRLNLSDSQTVSITSCVRQRELGLQSRRGRHAASKPLTYRLTNQVLDTLGPKSTWTGASSDIHTVAWSPDGQHFAAGAVAVTDVDSMQYNRPNVLMYGDTTNDNIHELGRHCMDRPKTDAGANSSHAMYVSQDPRLYTTVSSVAFSPSGRLMYSAGYDHSVCIWDVAAVSQQPRMVRELQHKAPVDCLAINQSFAGVIATATKRTTDKSIKLVYFEEETVNDEQWQPLKANFASPKAMNRPDLKMSANTLKFDPTGRLLLAGFGANMREDSGLDTSGDICLWDVETQSALQVHGSSRNVFDVTFNAMPRQKGMFAVGCVANGNVNRGTRSVVRFYTPKETKYTCPLELECKAFDMNDVVWCPYDGNLIAAGCTDGRSYIWDLRMPNRLLYTLSHGSSLMPLQDGVPHERTDTGVRFLSWGQNAKRLYSGSSDGVVKVWDVTQSQEGVFIDDLITTNSGIMSGAFTADYSKLVLGEVNGTANVLEVGRDDVALKDADRLTYHPYIGHDDEDSANGMVIDTPLPDSTDIAATEARKWLETGQLRLAPMGGFPKQQVIQGPNYEGPFDPNKDAHTQCLREEAFGFQRSMAIPKEPQCNLPGCANNINTTTYEDVGDSGRSADRIPHELRRQWLDDTSRVVPGKSKCTYCSRPAIPSLGADGAFCERCLFACFRCGGANYITGATSTLECGSCGGKWDVGALGYECSGQPKATSSHLNVPTLESFDRESHLERLEDAETAFGDDMNALTDYYFGLAIDRPESPPL